MLPPPSALRSGCRIYSLFLCLISPNAWANCQMIEVGRLPVEVVSNALLVPGKINGQEIKILVDTGSQDSFFLLDAVEAAGLNPTTESRYYLENPRGDSTAYKVTIARLDVGSSKIEGKVWPVFDVSNPDIDVGMVLGADFWSELDYEIDLANGTIVLWDNKDCDKASLGYWSKEIMLALLKKKHGEYPEVNASINATPLTATIDTGTPVTFIHPVLAERIGYRKEDNSEGAHVGTFDVFEMGDLTIKNAHMLVPRKGTYILGPGSHLRGQTGSDGNLILGTDFLSANHILVANSQGYLYMTYNGGQVFQTHFTGLASAEEKLQQDKVEATEHLSKQGAEALLRGMIAVSKGQYSAAEPDLQAAYEEMRASGNLATQPGLDAMAKLAESLLRQEKSAAAALILEELIPVEERVSGSDHKNVGMYLHFLGVTYIALHKYQEAVVTLSKALPILEKAFGPEGRESTEALISLGTALEGAADYKLAEGNYSRALTIAERRPDVDQLEVVRALLNVGRMMETQGRNQEAITTYQRAHDIMVSQSGDKEMLVYIDQLIKHAQEAATR